MLNKQQIAAKKTLATRREDQERTAVQLLLNTAKDRRLEKAVQKRIRQLKTNYRCRAFDSSSSLLFDSSSLFNSSTLSVSFSSISNSSSSNSFVFELSIEDLSTRDILFDQQVDFNRLSIDSNRSRDCEQSTKNFLQISALLRCTIRASISKKRYKDRLIERLFCMQLSKTIRLK